MPDGDVYICGHSLGAARAYEYAFSRVKRGLRVDGIYALAPPNPGDSAIGAGLAQVPIIRALKNRRDLVPDVPVDMPLIGEEYVQPRPFEEINEPPIGLPTLWADHSVALYVAGARKLPQYGASVALADAADQIARLYQDATGWDWINPVDGDYWAMKIMPNGARLMLARGSVTLRDWLDDFDATMTPVLGAKMSCGFWRGIEPVQDALDAQLS